MKVKELKEHLYNSLIKKNVYEIDGKKLIEESSIESIPNIHEPERQFIKRILKEKNIEIVKNMIAPKNRSNLVKDNEFGNIETSGYENLEKPKYARFEYNQEGEIIKEDYKELREFLDKEFIPNNQQMKQRIVKYKEKEIFPSIQYNKLVQIKLSEKEIKYTIKYLEELGIRVCGMEQGLDGEYENYDYYNTYKNSILPTPLTNEEIIEKFTILRATNDPIIREQIILTSMRLVPWCAWIIAKKYDFNIDDAIQYGYEGLIKAVDNFDETKGFTFSTYAVPCIKGYVKRGILGEYEINNQEWISKYQMAKNIVEKSFNQTIYDNPNLIEEIVELLLHIEGKPKTKKDEYLKKIGYIEKLSLEESTDIPINTEYEEIAVDNAATKEISEIFKDILSTLSPKEQKVINLRFGLNGNFAKSLEEIGKEMGLSRERIRQIEAKALRKLRHPSRSKRIKDYQTHSSLQSYEDDFISTVHINKR